jgi:hypothetical protein
MKVFYINNTGAGFADPIDVADGTTLGQLFAARMPGCNPGDFLIRVNFTPYWSIARRAGCLLRHGERQNARAPHPGILRVSADFSLGRAWNAVTGAKKTC